MASNAIRKLDDEVKTRLRIRAVENGHSMEEEARIILRDAVDLEPILTRRLGVALHELVKPFGGVELDFPPRGPMRDPVRFDWGGG